MKYNVVELRRSASRVRQASETVKSAGQGNISRVHSGLAGCFRGEAADALNQELSSLQNDLQRLAGGLAAISNELYAFALRLEQADATAADYIQKH